MRKHTPRKHYRPGHVLLPQQRDDIVLPVHMALDIMEMGHGTEDHRNTLAAFLNLSSIIAARLPGTAKETRWALHDAIHALSDTDKRYQRTGRFGFTGQGMQHLRKAIVLSDALIQRASTSLVLQAVEYVAQLDQEERPQAITHNAL